MMFVYRVKALITFEQVEVGLPRLPEMREFHILATDGVPAASTFFEEKLRSDEFANDEGSKVTEYWVTEVVEVCEINYVEPVALIQGLKNLGVQVNVTSLDTP